MKSKRGAQGRSPAGRGRPDIHGRREQSRAAIQSQLTQAKAALATSRSSSSPEMLVRPGITSGNLVHYASTADPSAWLRPDAGRPLIEGLLTSIQDGADRALFCWPHRPGSGFVIAAVALREARSTGRLAHSTVAYWPWRSGTTWAARQVLVNPVDLAQVATQAVNEIDAGAEWASPNLAHKSLCMIEMRLRDLRSTEAKKNLIVRSPTLLETTCVFSPNRDKRQSAYNSDTQQILRRVREHTHMGDPNAGLEGHLEAVGRPISAPFAVLGLPPVIVPEALGRFLSCPRIEKYGLDAIVVDLTRTGRSDLQEDWELHFEALLKALDSHVGRRPPIVMFIDDAFVMRRATRLANRQLASAHPRRKLRESGVYLDRDGIFGAESRLPQDLAPISFEADIKDASLAPIRRRLLSLGRDLKRSGVAFAASAAATVLRFVRRSASSPLGLREAQEIADILFDGEDEVDGAIRAMFRPKMALGQLGSIKDVAPEFGVEADSLLSAIEGKCANWVTDSPVSAKLSSLLADAKWNSSRSMISISERTVAELFMASDRALSCRCSIVDHGSLASRLQAEKPQRLLLLGPTPEAIRALLTAKDVPHLVALLGDVAGASLLGTEVAPLERLPEFSGFSARARAFVQALGKGGGDEELDISEVQFRIEAKPPEGEIDLTRSDDAYRGDVVRLTTSRGHKLVYRPASDVLIFRQSEVRPFERIAARELDVGESILVLDETVREPIRKAMAGSRQSLRQLALYHDHITRIRAALPGGSDTDKARYVLEQMRGINPAVGAHEVPNIRRWLTADLAPGHSDGVKQPRAAQDQMRFGIFMKAVGVPVELADVYWKLAILPTRAFRAREGHAFNQRVVQFVLDPEGTSSGFGAWKTMPGLWQIVIESVDQISEIMPSSSAAGGSHA